ncbi:hypothetical protein ACFSUS_10655 [Spirosoma soli]|uniref:Uncharacterized protein n=1 Tax=Spirosoma soli TaxID=1770529 RepID=A0ABW5M3J4_9BACT
MDIQLYDTYFVLPWYTCLPIVLTFVLIGLLVAMTRLGLRKLFFVSLCAAVGLLVSLSQWVNMATSIVSTLTPNLTGQSKSDQGWLNNLLPLVFSYQLIVGGVILLLSWRMLNRAYYTR